MEYGGANKGSGMSAKRLISVFQTSVINSVINNEFFILDEFYLSAVVGYEDTVRQTKVMSDTDDDRQRAVAEHSSNALRLFEEAKSIQRRLRQLPVLKRRNAMDQVNDLERKAIAEAQESIALKKRLS